MKIFLSWSKDYSKEVAIVFKDWLKLVIQQLDPFMSEKDIELGTNWNDEIKTQLSQSKLGLIFITEENLNSQWLNYEVGALASSFEKSKVIPILIDVQSVGTSPLSQFQSTKQFDKNNILKVIQSINSSLDGSRLDEATLNETFNVFWPRLDERLKQVDLKFKSQPSKKVAKEKIDTEVLLTDLVNRSDFTINFMNEIKDQIMQLNEQLYFSNSGNIDIDTQSNRAVDAMFSIVSSIEQIEEMIDQDEVFNYALYNVGFSEKAITVEAEFRNRLSYLKAQAHKYLNYAFSESKSKNKNKPLRVR